MKPGEWHDVVQGEAVESIAAACGHLTATIWDAPDNASLKDRRKDPHVLMPGDRLFIPPIEPRTFQVQMGASASFKVTRPAARLRVQLMKADAPRANEPFVLTVDGREERGTTDGDGRVDAPIPARAERAVLIVGEGETATRYELELRALDPIDEVSGVQARLRNLGYDAGPVDGILGPRTGAAISAFQHDEGLEVTGEPGSSTQDALRSKYGG